MEVKRPHELVWAEREFENRCEKGAIHFYRLAYEKGLPALVHPMLCKKRTCEKCGWFWQWRWLLMLKHKAESDARLGNNPIRRAVTLTTAYDPGFEKCWYAIKMFWELLRDYSFELTVPKGKTRRVWKDESRKGEPIALATRPYRYVQYWGSTEYNQKHTQPHFHFILHNDQYIPMTLIKSLWIKAQKQAGFDKIAWDTRIEEIKTDVSKYFTKYIAKMTGGKDEIPRRENWRGRFIRYSRKFFDVPTGCITVKHGWDKYCSDPHSERSYYLTTQGTPFQEFKQRAGETVYELTHLLNRPWDWEDDNFRGKPLPQQEEMFSDPPPIEMAPPWANLTDSGKWPAAEYCNLPTVTHLSCAWFPDRTSTLIPDPDPDDGQ